MAVIIAPLPVVGSNILLPYEERNMQKVLVDVNGCICPNKEPYTKMKNMRKAEREGPGKPLIFPEDKKAMAEAKKAAQTDG